MGETLAPKRLGAGFRWLIASSWASNLGDGFALAAGPLLVASQTHDPTLVAMATLLQRLPWLLFGVFAGAVADRFDRVRIVMVVDSARAGVLALLGAAVVTGRVSIAVVLVALFLLGTAEAFSNTAMGTVLPSLVAREDLALANARLQTGFVTVYQLLGPPVGAALFAIGMCAPFLCQAALVLAGAGLVAKVVLPRSPAADDPAPPSRVRHDIAAGFRWVAVHPPVRTLVLTIFSFNVTFGAAWSVLVLYAHQRLGLGSIGFGLLTTAMAIGGVLGTACYGRITKRLSLGNIMRIGLAIETLTHLGLALTTAPAVAFGIMVVFGAHAFVWSTTSVTVRQRAVPRELQGRVGSINNIANVAGLVIGAAIGGPIASGFGITAPFWFGFAGSGVLLLLIWRQLTQIIHADNAPAADVRAPS